MEAKELRYLLEELKVFHRNLLKDPVERRTKEKYITRKVARFIRLKENYIEVKNEFNSASYSSEIIKTAKQYAESIDHYLVALEKLFLDRLGQGTLDLVKSRISTTLKQYSDSETEAEANFGRVDKNSELIMAEKFDLRTAASLLPIMDSSEVVIRRLVEGITFYDALLGHEDKKLLTKYVLTTRLSQSAKIRLETNELLVRAIEENFLPKRSVSLLSVRLSNARQGTKSIDNFGKFIEELMLNLTIAQANGERETMGFLADINEKLAINSFANGLNNNNLRTILKARNYSKLSDVIRGALDEESLSRDSTQQLYHIRGRGSFSQRQNWGRRGSNYSYRGNNNIGYNNGAATRASVHSSQRGNWNPRNPHGRYSGDRFNHGSRQTRGANPNFRAANRLYYAGTEQTPYLTESIGTNSQLDKFFRD